jgi:predicted DNA-binding transcriptional regulator AlpA
MLLHSKALPGRLSGGRGTFFGKNLFHIIGTPSFPWVLTCMTTAQDVTSTPRGDIALDLPTRIERRRRALKVSELADLVHISGNRLYEMVARGQVPSYRIAGSIRFDPKTTAEWLRAQAA